MIKFFRKIRYDLMEQNKTGKYFKYAIGEIVLVVIGILIALSINNWNENRKNNEVRRNYYIQMLQDFEKDKINIEKGIKAADSFFAEVQSYKEIFKQPDLPIWEIATRMGKVFASHGDWNFESNNNTVTTLQNTGDIKLISPVIRNKILDFKNKQSGLMDYVKLNTDALTNSLLSTSTLYGGSDLGRRIGNQPKLIKYYSDENIQIQSLMGLEAFLASEMTLFLNVQKRNKELVIYIEEITELIKEEIKK
jgi:hypothetical protein